MLDSVSKTEDANDPPAYSESFQLASVAAAPTPRTKPPARSARMRRATKRRAGVESLTWLLCEFCFEVPDNFARGLLRKVVIRSDLEAERFRCAGQNASTRCEAKARVGRHSAHGSASTNY